MTYFADEAVHRHRVVEELTARAIADQAALTERCRLLLDRVATGDVDPVRMRIEYRELVQEHSARLANQITDISAEYYRSLLDLNRQYVEHLIDRLGVATRSNGDAHFAPSEPQPPTSSGMITARGRPGEVASVSFVVENPESEPSRVRFFVSDVVDVDGQRCGPLEVEPLEVLVAPRSEARVEVRVELDPAHFRPMARYAGQILARGAREFVVEVAVLVDDPDDPA
jgi:hypothetical protein